MKNLKKFSVLVIINCFAFVALGQDEKKEFTFKMDSVIAEFLSQLSQQKVDTILHAYYYFDNGRGDKATFLSLWTKNGKHYVNAIKTAKTNSFIEFPTKECSEFSSILNFYFENYKEIVKTRPESNWISHNYGYTIILRINETEFKTYLRDEKRFGDKEHFRSKWINMIDKIVRTYIEEK